MVIIIMYNPRKPSPISWFWVGSGKSRVNKIGFTRIPSGGFGFVSKNLSETEPDRIFNVNLKVLNYCYV